MKKVFIILLCGVMALTLTACGKDGTSYVYTPQSSSEAPYKEPGGNGGVTNVGDGTAAEDKRPGTTSPSESKSQTDYELEDDFGEVSILRYHGKGGKLSIPVMIDGQTITKIDEYAFRGTAVTHVTIPGTIKTIETRAFTGCDLLETLTIAEGVQTIDGYAFADCPKLTLVTLPDSLKEIGEDAFRDCPAIKLTFRGKTYTAVEIKELYDDVILGGFII